MARLPDLCFELTSEPTNRQRVGFAVQYLPLALPSTSIIRHQRCVRDVKRVLEPRKLRNINTRGQLHPDEQQNETEGVRCASWIKR